MSFLNNNYAKENVRHFARFATIYTICENTHEVVLLLVKLQVEPCNLTKSNTPPWMFFTFFKLRKC